MLEEKISCDSSKTITEDELNTNNNDEIFAPISYDAKWTNITLITMKN